MRELLQWGGDLMTLFQDPSFMLEQWNALAQGFGFESLQDMKIPFFLVSIGSVVLVTLFLYLKNGYRAAMLAIITEFLLVIGLALAGIQGRWTLAAIIVLAILEVVF